MYEQNRSGNEEEREEGRRWGQGWYLEDKTSHCLLNQGYWPNERVRIWGREVDVVARREESLSCEPDRVATPVPARVLVSCVDWFDKETITPCRLWRLIALAYTVQAEPVLVYNNRTQLTSTAQDIAERWKVRTVTDEDLETGMVLPEPESGEYPSNPAWPSPLRYEVPIEKMNAPTYNNIL